MFIPLPDSKAIDAGNSSLAGSLAGDQRGAGFRRILNGSVDVGAIEATVIVLNNALYVYGTDKSDTIWVHSQSFPLLQSVDHEDVFSWKWEGDSFASTTVFLLGGNDVFESTNGTNLSETAVIVHGGDGNDSITGGNAGDTLRGNGGDDILFGKSGDDVLLGGEGLDNLHFNGGDTEIIRLSSPATNITEGVNFQLVPKWPDGVQQATVSWGDGSLRRDRAADDVQSFLPGR